MKTKHPRSVAIEVAKELRPFLEPVTFRLACAGSLRRNREMVSDLELLYVPRYESRPDGLFDRKDVDLAGEALDRLVAIGMLSKRPNVNGHLCWGEKNKLAVHVRTGLSVDFFSTTEAHWFVSLVIRTGPSDFNIRLIESAAKHGLKLHAYASDSGLTDKKGNDVPCTSEEQVFELAGMHWLAPHERRA